jgi:hypothetical protein
VGVSRGNRPGRLWPLWTPHPSRLTLGSQSPRRREVHPARTLARVVQPELRERDETPTTADRKGHVPPMVIPHDDPGMQSLVRALDEFPGISAFGPRTDEGRLTDEAHTSIEFLAWWAYQWAPDGVELLILGKSPHNYPGRMLFARWVGRDPENSKGSPAAIAILLSVWRREAYITAEEARNWTGT